ncbi:MAG: DNA repair protein RecN [Chloroflexi bacterium]|nr:DNA repair protein RecN [Chloroflexota bacterium]
MLAHLRIENFAVVERVRIDWGPGLNVITGETGAGKSIIVDALGALLGDRLSPEVIREGAARATVEAVFDVDLATARHAALRGVLEQNGLLDEGEGEQLILSREIQRNGRGVARVSGRAVTVGVLGQIGEQLVDIHSQTEHLSLLRVREHLELLDRAGGLLEQRVEFGTVVQRLRRVQAERRALQDEIRRASRERELLTHEVNEIEAAGLAPGEDAELETRRRRLRNVVRLRQSTERALVALEGGDEAPGAVDQLGSALDALTDGARLDPELSGTADGVDRLASEAQELGRSVREYLERLEADPRALEEIELRILAIGDLKRKYGETVETILAYLATARARLQTAERGEEMLGDLTATERALREQTAALALGLSHARRLAASEVSVRVQSELRDLNLPHAQFIIRVDQQPADDGLAVECENGEARTVAFDATGVDRVEFLFSANPGEGPRGLARIASGGELARVSLALKTALSREDSRGTLIFDEIDVGVGGRTGPVVGKKLWGLATTHQVLCVTHMPQVAAFADQHLVVSKGVHADRTSTDVATLDHDEQIGELAAMLGGASSGAARANAAELLESSDAWKRAAPASMDGGVSRA